VLSMRESERQRVRVGVPYRNTIEELTGKSEAHSRHLRAVEAAEGEALAISLRLSPGELEQAAQALDAFVLPGSPRDVNPPLYKASRHPKTAEADPDRERTDYFLLEHAFRVGKPVLAICYGAQLLNVFLGGTLVQDIEGELGSTLQHEWRREDGQSEPYHKIRSKPGTLVSALANGNEEVVVNSSHHQSVRDAGEGLRITAVGPDGVVEAVEWMGGSEWVVGVQWHPERMVGSGAGDFMSQALFRTMLEAARAGSIQRGAVEFRGRAER
jgi:putative glutamine amidotransferase